MLLRRSLLLIPLLLLGTAPVLAQSVGVTAAVNQSARGTQPGTQVRTIVLGDNVISNERIETNGVGLVQILLADGTTFTVGPNSALVIDSFVYNPQANTAQVAATLTKGVFRFVGGQTSKTENGVSLKTPVGTVGIRGAVVDINLTPTAGTPVHIDMIFGRSVDLWVDGDSIAKIYQAGYSIVIGPDGSARVEKTPPGFSSQIQTALAGKPGTNGGAPQSPTDKQVANSGVPENNSERPYGSFNPTDPSIPVVSPEQLADILVAIATMDEVRQEVIEGTEEPGGAVHESTLGPGVYQGFVAGVVRVTNEGETQEAILVSPYGEGGTQLSNVTLDGESNPTEANFYASANDGETTTNVSYQGSNTNGFISDGENTAPATADIRSNEQDIRVDALAPCDCSFVQWGWWSVDATLAGDNDLQVADGTWVVGDIGDLENVTDAPDAGMHATYSGFAVGTVLNGDQTYAASGTLDLDWDFNYGLGTIDITDFDGHDFNGYISPNGNSFYGSLGGDASGVATGAFVYDGEEAAAGVIGDFGVTDGESWSAGGIFAGGRGLDAPGEIVGN